jgi:hypothetical protein
MALMQFPTGGDLHQRACGVSLLGTGKGNRPKDGGRECGPTGHPAAICRNRVPYSKFDAVSNGAG